MALRNSVTEALARRERYSTLCWRSCSCDLQPEKIPYTSWHVPTQKFGEMNNDTDIYTPIYLGRVWFMPSPCHSLPRLISARVWFVPNPCRTCGMPQLPKHSPVHFGRQHTPQFRRPIWSPHFWHSRILGVACVGIEPNAPQVLAFLISYIQI
jgi:hypothetical protein